jgi:hypothetical protein
MLTRGGGQGGWLWTNGSMYTVKLDSLGPGRAMACLGREVNLENRD